MAGDTSVNSGDLHIKNLSTLALHSNDSLYATKSGKIKSESKFNVFGRLWHWFKDPKGERLDKAVGQILNQLESLPGFNDKITIDIEGDGKKKTVPIKKLMIDLIDHK